MALKGHAVYNSAVENAAFSSAPPPVDSVETRRFPLQSGRSPNHGVWDGLFQVHVAGFQG